MSLLLERVCKSYREPGGRKLPVLGIVLGNMKHELIFPLALVRRALGKRLLRDAGQNQQHAQQERFR